MGSTGVGELPYFCTIHAKLQFMNRIFLLLFFLLPAVARGQTLQECWEAAERNYPLIRQYGLIDRTTGLTVENIRRAWLPQVTVSAQTTVQSDVTAFPDELDALYRQMGITMKGLRRDQYRVGIDVQQMVYDGGATRSRRDITRREGELQRAQTEVDLYRIRRRVNEMYFGLLLVDEQIRLNADLQQVLSANEQKLRSMFDHGTAAESDYLSVRAERLDVCRRMTELQSQRAALVRWLSTFCGTDVTQAVKPAVPRCQSFAVNLRPELRVIDARIRLADAREQALDAARLPQVGLFAQGFYGYPGYNMFDDMMHRRFSLNAMIGLRVSWSLSPFYTRRGDKARLHLQRDAAGVDRDVFLFENRLEQLGQDENIRRYRRLMADDEEIISLRASIRRAAESKLEHGVIDVNDLVREINNENAARVEQTVHEIELLREMYDLKFTTNQ